MITQEKIDEHEAECMATIASAGKGPWSGEPHRHQWQHAGLDCLMVRQPKVGHWCGYVGVKPSHPDFGKSYNDVEYHVHGGLTYAEECDGSVCHITTEPSDKTWWFGFDCAHLGDSSPIRAPGFAQYRNFDYVRRETQHLAEQLAQKGEKDAVK